jgi:ribosomal protein L3 glutamine methyltransferase
MIDDALAAVAVEELCTCRDFLRWGETCLRRNGVFHGHGFDDPWDEMLHLLLHVLHLPHDSDPRLLDARLLREEKQMLVALLQRRINQRVPVSYLTGEAWFCGLPFYVNEDVLIPRSPIAELIENGFQPWLAEGPARILDLCTGSGCIGIALAHAFPQAEVDACDLSDAALKVAADNVARFRLEDRVRLFQGDGLQAVADSVAERGYYDLIVSNPPYVDAEDMASLPEEYRHEPVLALESGQDGLDFVRRLLETAADFLTDSGLLIVEVGNSASALETAFPELPFFWFEFERGGQGVFMLRRDDLAS